MNMRSGYRTRVRFWRGRPETAVIRWYKCKKGAPALGWVSCITSLDWMGFPWLQHGPGEVFNRRRRYHQDPPIPGADGHTVCGTEDDFRLGGQWLPELPPVLYNADGLPVCCGVEERRGVLIGGGGIVSPRRPYQGGVVVSGAAYLGSDPSYYEGASTDPEVGIAVYSELPLEVCTVWRSTATGYQWELSASAPRGTVGNWRLIELTTGATWETSGWDGLDPSTVFLTLVSGEWPGLVSVSLGI